MKDFAWRVLIFVNAYRFRSSPLTGWRIAGAANEFRKQREAKEKTDAER